MSKPKIAIVNSSSFGRYFPEHLERLQDFADVRQFQFPSSVAGAELAKELGGAHGIIASVTPRFSRDFFSQVKELKIVARHGIGYDNVDLKAATAAGVIVTNVPGPIERDTVAEHSVTLMLALVRHIAAGAQAVKEGRWADRAGYLGFEIRGRTVGIIGMGNIGSRVAEIFRDGFQARVIAYDPFVQAAEFKRLGVEQVGLDQLLQRSELISLNCALTESNVRLLRAPQFATMRPGVCIVNNARPEILDQDALCEALRSGHLGGYATDVVEGEPIVPPHPLLEFNNVIVVPHLGGYTHECVKGMGDSVVADMELVLNRREVPTRLLNPEVLSRERL